MITPELSYYPTSVEDEQLLRQFERARLRDTAVGDVGRLATLITTGGLAESSSHEAPTPRIERIASEPTQRTLGATALMSHRLDAELVTPLHIETAEALRHQEAIEEALCAAYQLAA